MLIGYKPRPVAARAWSRIGGTALEVWGSELTLADANAARKRAGIVVDAVVGDLQVMRPTVYEDAAAALGAVSDAQPIDAGRVANEVAREPVGPIRPIGAKGIKIAQVQTASHVIGPAGVTCHPSKQCGAGRECAWLSAVAPGNRPVEVKPLGQYGDQI